MLEGCTAGYHQPRRAVLPDGLIVMGMLILVKYSVVRAFDFPVHASIPYCGLGLFDVPAKRPACEDFSTSVSTS